MVRIRLPQAFKTKQSLRRFFGENTWRERVEGHVVVQETQLHCFLLISVTTKS